MSHGFNHWNYRKNSKAVRVSINLIIDLLVDQFGYYIIGGLIKSCPY